MLSFRGSGAEWAVRRGRGLGLPIPAFPGRLPAEVVVTWAGRRHSAAAAEECILRRGAEAHPKCSSVLTVPGPKTPPELVFQSGLSPPPPPHGTNKTRCVTHSQTLQPTQHQPLLCDWIQIKVLPRQTSLDPHSRGLLIFHNLLTTLSKCQGLKTWVRVLQRQECQRQQKDCQLLYFTKHTNLTNKAEYAKCLYVTSPPADYAQEKINLD